MASAIEPGGSKDLAFRSICKERCKWAIVYSAVLQYFLMTIFLLFVNFNILHPINWITGTIRLLFSFYTWLVSTPLAAAVIIHGVVLAKPSLQETRYCSTHFGRWYRNLTQRAVLLLSSGTVGCLTAWLYTRFLRDDCRLLFLPNGENSTVLNERFIYLLMCGLFSGCYFFTKGQSNPIATEFRIVLLRKVVQFRNSFYTIFAQSMKRSFVASLAYIGFFLIFSLLFRYKIAALLGGARLQEVSTMSNFFSIVTDVRLLIYTWLLISLILSNMSLIHVLFNIFLTEPEEFTLDARTPNEHDPLLADALMYRQIPLVQQLAAEDLFLVANTRSDERSRRNQLYLLTNPGGHPKNWRSLCDTCIKLIRDFSHDLDQSIQGIDLKPLPPMVMIGGTLRPTSSMDHERFLMRQYNQNFGVRSLSSPELQSESASESKGKGQHGHILSPVLQRIPAYGYYFEECKTAKSYYLLSVQSQLIVKIVQSLAAIVSCSLMEDQYGVVQSDIPCVIHELLALKKVVDKIGSKNIDVKKIDRNYITLKGAIKRSMYRITIAFEPYIKDLLLEPTDLEALRPFLNFNET